MGEFARGKEGRELCQLRVEAVDFLINSKGLSGGEEKDVTVIWWANWEWRGSLSTQLDLPRLFRSSNDGL